MIDVGVARARAQGQKTTKTVTALIISDVIKYAAIAIIKAAGTSQPAHLSTILCIGALFSSASFTILISL